MMQAQGEHEKHTHILSNYTFLTRHTNHKQCSFVVYPATAKCTVSLRYGEYRRVTVDMNIKVRAVKANKSPKLLITNYCSALIKCGVNIAKQVEKTEN